MSIGIGIGIGMNQNENNLSQFGRAKQLTTLLTDNRVPFVQVGDSNQAQDTGSHWQAATIALKTLYGAYGSRMMGDAHGSFASDTGIPLGVSPGGHVDFSLIDTGADATLLSKSMFSLTEYNTAIAAGAGASTNFVPGFVGTFNRLASGSDSPSGTTISGQNAVLISKNGTLFGDLASIALEVHASYYIPATNPGTWHPNIRFELSVSSLTPSAITYNTATANVTDVVVPVPIDATANNRSYQNNRIAVNQSSGDLYVGYTQVVKPAQTTGASVSLWYGVGGYTFRNFSRDLTQLKANHSLAIREYLRELQRPVIALGQQPSLVFWSKFAGNDAGDGNASILYNGTASGPASNTKAGYTRNLQTAIEIIYDEWVALGYNPNRIFFICGGYHPQAAEPYATNQPLFETGALELAATTDHPSHGRLIVIKGSLLTTPSEMTTLSWYKPADTAHLSTDGFTGLVTREVDALVDLSNGIAQTQQG